MQTKKGAEKEVADTQEDTHTQTHYIYK